MIRRFVDYMNEMKSRSSSISSDEFDNLYDIFTSYDLKFYTKNLHDKKINLADLNSKVGKERFSKKERSVANYIHHKLSKSFDTSTTGLGNMIIHSENVAIHDDLLCSEKDILFQARIPEKTIIKFTDKEKETFGDNVEENLSVSVYFKLDYKPSLYEKYNKMFEKDTGIEEGDERIYRYNTNNGEKIIINFIKWRIDEVLVKTTEIYDEGTDQEDIETYIDDSSNKIKHVSPLFTLKQVMRDINFYEKNIKRLK